MSRKPREQSTWRADAPGAPPEIIRVLERIEHLARLPTVAECAMARLRDPELDSIRDALRPALQETHEVEMHRQRELLDLVGPILRTWRQAENQTVLRHALGLGKPSRRRKELTANRELEIAVAVFEHEARGNEPAAAAVADEYHVDESTVRKYAGKWEPRARAYVTAIRAQNGGMPIDYRGMFTDRP